MVEIAVNSFELTFNGFVVLGYVMSVLLVIYGMVLLHDNKAYGFVSIFVGTMLFLTLITSDSSLNRMKDAHTAYRAYDDGVITSGERRVFKEYVGREGIDVNYVLDRMGLEYLHENGLDEPDVTILAEYEAIVNGIIGYADPSEDKLAFKRYVVYQDRGMFDKIWDDRELDEVERDLVMFAGDLVGRDVEGLVENLEYGRVKSGVDEYNNLLGDLRSEYDVFNVADLKVVGRVDDGVYKVK